MSKYEPLKDYLVDKGTPEIPMTFDAVEQVIGAELPRSAFDHRAWWSNNPSNSVITRAWLNAGYKSAEVDMTGRKLVFRKSDAEGTPAGADDPGAPETPQQSIVSRIAAALKGTVTVKPGTDLTEPVDVEWDAAR